MIKDFILHFRQTYAEEKLWVLLITFSITVAVIVFSVILDIFFFTGFFGFLANGLVVIHVSRFIKGLAWYWGPLTKTLAPQTRSIHENMGFSRAIEVGGDFVEGLPDADVHGAMKGEDRETEPALGCVPVRKTPVGTELISLTTEEARIRVKSVVRFWGWFLPTFLFGCAVTSIPVGAWIGFEFYVRNVPRWDQSVEGYFSAMALGAALLCGMFGALAVQQFFSTRPRIRIIIDQDYVTVENRRFDRRFSYGFLIGHTDGRAELRPNIIRERFGVTLLRLEYGPWGEDLKYMVDSYHADEIVIWLNEIANAVGALELPRNDSYSGRKIELL